MFLQPRDCVGKEYYVRLRYYDGQGEYDSLRTIIALDREDALAQVDAYARSEGMFWYNVDIPTVPELTAMRAKFQQQWREHNNKPKGSGPS